MPTTVCRLEDLGPAELDRWSRLQRGDAALHSPFLRPAFAVAVGRRRPDARVAVVEDGGEVIAFLPFERGRAGVGRALAHDVSDYQGVVHAPGLDWHGPELLKACAVWPRAHHGRRLGLVRGRDPGRPQPGHAAHRPVLQDPARRAAPRRRPIARGPVYDQAGGDQRVQPRPHHTSSAAVSTMTNGPITDIAALSPAHCELMASMIRNKNVMILCGAGSSYSRRSGSFA